ncbi:probable cytochrome P450 4s3 [Pieris rapae]|uniref:probable cytochrome P450 4s3 n=1 Tax=Pieris rapae TaxID=64459 RepID=UPI001E27D390|nr:probable cytochrome P450 4s3 [Pieris rapae]
MFYLLVVIGAILLCVYCVLQRCNRNWKMLREYPGDYRLPIIGNGLQLGFDSEKSSDKIFKLWKKHGMKNFRMTVGSEEWLLVTNPDDVATILNHPTQLCKQVERNTGMQPLFGNSLSTSEGERWRLIRKLLTPSFHFKTLEKKIDTVNQHCDRLFELLDEQDKIDAYKYLKAFMLDTVCSSLMGVDMKFLDSIDHPYFEAGDTAMKIITENYFSYWRSLPCLITFTKLYKETQRIAKILDAMSNDVIAQRRKKIQKLIEYAENNKNHVMEHDVLTGKECLLDRLILSKLYCGVTLTEDIISEEVKLVCWTGHHTTGLALSHALYFIAKFPEVQHRVLQEQKLIFGNDRFKKPNHKEINEMKYLEAVIKESIRVLPAITKISRHLKNDLQLKDGRVVPANTTVVIFFKGMYQDPKLLTEPEKYNPDRFFSPIHNYAFVPFSSGPRNCIGFRFAWAAMKGLISNIIRRYEFSLAGPGTEPQFVYRLMTESSNGIQLNIKRRVYS